MDQEPGPPRTQESEALTRHLPALQVWFRRRLQDADAAADLCQETLARFLSRAPELVDATRTRPYLFRTARNLLADHFRRRRPAADLESIEAEAEPETSTAQALHPAEARVFRRELEQRLRSLLPALPADQRLAFELGVLFELPYAEIARRQGCSVAKVKVDVYRARKALVDGLQPFLRESDASGSARSAAPHFAPPRALLTRPRRPKR